MMKDKIQSDHSLLNRLTVGLKRVDHYIEEWVQHFVEQIEGEHPH